MRGRSKSSRLASWFYPNRSWPTNCLAVALFFGSLGAAAQKPLFSRITDQSTGEPLPLASIVNLSTGLGTVSGTEGEFQLHAKTGDSLLVAYIGYHHLRLIVTNPFPTELPMQPRIDMLGEVTVSAPDQEPLFQLIDRCRKNAPPPFRARTYFELQTHVNGEMTELLDAFYNGSYDGYDVRDLGFRAGRIGWRTNPTLFFSLETSRTFLSFTAFGSNPHYPIAPLNLSGRKMRKAFLLSERNRFPEKETGDTVVEIRFFPRDTSGAYFSGTYRIRIRSAEILEMELTSRHARPHPFLPIHPADSIRSADLHLRKTFPGAGGSPTLTATFLDYHLDYKSSRQGALNVSSAATLYAFDRDSLYFLPLFDFQQPNANDYRKIQAYPFDPAFWADERGYGLPDLRGKNDLFFSHPSTVTNEHLFRKNLFGRQGLFEFPFLFWSETDRIGLLELPGAGEERRGIPEDLYHLDFKLQLDARWPAGKPVVRTFTVVDPMSTYYRLPVDSVVLCFVNIWADLVEMERRRLQDEVNQSDGRPATLRRLFNLANHRLEELGARYRKEVQRGSNLEMLMKWNALVKEELGIDNAAFFGVLER